MSAAGRLGHPRHRGCGSLGKNSLGAGEGADADESQARVHRRVAIAIAIAIANAIDRARDDDSC
jgi:hypothetical protein